MKKEVVKHDYQTRQQGGFLSGQHIFLYSLPRDDESMVLSIIKHSHFPIIPVRHLILRNPICTINLLQILQLLLQHPLHSVPQHALPSNALGTRISGETCSGPSSVNEGVDWIRSPYNFCGM
jgi:hypothetical protein